MKIYLYYIGKPKDPHANAIAADFVGRAIMKAKALPKCRPIERILAPKPVGRAPADQGPAWEAGQGAAPSRTGHKCLNFKLLAGWPMRGV